LFFARIPDRFLIAAGEKLYRHMGRERILAMTTCDVAIVGAGPYGLSAAAHLQRVKGLDVRVFGEPMGFWKNQMPEGMLLRSPCPASNLSDPDARLTLDALCAKTVSQMPVPIPLDRFVDYGLWFQQEAVPDVDRRHVTCIERAAKGFRMMLVDGESFVSRRVVIATGIGPFACRPPEFLGLPADFVTHSSDQSNVRRFGGKRVVVVGAGQSALESAALIHEAGGHVEVIARTPRVHWLGWRARLQRLGPIVKLLYSPYDIGPAGVSRIVAVPDLVKCFPRPIQDRFRVRALRPAGARWLIARMANVPISTARSVVAAVPAGDELHLELDDGTSRRVDHVLLGTGYRVDVARYPFLPSDLSRGLVRSDGFPKLCRGFESSVPGLHFLGALSAWTYGPLMYFVAGTEYAARSLARFIARSGPKSLG
jgi:Pyridine nucleotide-disulphide oxidoreductase